MVVSVVAMLQRELASAMNQDGTAKDVRKSVDESSEIDQCGRDAELFGRARFNADAGDWNKG